MNITLIPTIANPEGISKELIQEALPTLDSLFKEVKEVALTGKPATLTFLNAADEQGNTYKDMEFIIAARWYVNGDLWVSGAGFKVNFSEFITQTRNAFTQAL